MKRSGLVALICGALALDGLPAPAPKPAKQRPLPKTYFAGVPKEQKFSRRRKDRIRAKRRQKR